MQLSDDPNELLAQVSLANRQALKKLYDLTSAKLFAISLRITKQSALSEEALQDSFIKVWQNAHRFDPAKAQAITWVGTIVRNTSIDLLRRQNKFEQHDELDDSLTTSGDDNDNPEFLATQQYALQAVHLCLDELDTQHKKMILMAYLDGYTHQQIADIENTPIGSVKTWIHRGIDKVKHCLQRG